jgi:hypothetical protein
MRWLAWLLLVLNALSGLLEMQSAYHAAKAWNTAMVIFCTSVWAFNMVALVYLARSLREDR